MMKSGNGNPSRCMLNLISCFTGEVPYARDMGIKRENIDRPVTTVIARLATETRRMIEQFEPRVTVDNAAVKDELAAHGYFTIEAEATEKESQA
jgi:phage baseplate assembly protein W